MALVLLRIDDRLIHGQVVEGWLDVLAVNHIVIASDDIARDQFQQTLLSLAVPQTIKVSFFTVNDAAHYLKSQQKQKEKIILLVHGPQEALLLLELGVNVARINVGGMHYAEGKKQVLPFLSVNEDDRETFEKISQHHVKLEGKVLPEDESVDILEILRKVF